MTYWIAITVFCIGEQCMFWTSVKHPDFSQEACIETIKKINTSLKANGVNESLSTCVPFSSVGKES